MVRHIESMDMVRRSTGSRKPRQNGSSINQLDWHPVENRYPAMEVLSADQIDAICDTAYRILEEVGMDILHEGARDILKQAGADVDPSGERVRLDRGLIDQALAHAPSQVMLHARNPAHTLTIGGNRMAFGSVASAPNASDIVDGRRSGNQKDYRDFLKLGQSLNIIHFFGGYPVEPIDLPPSTRHLDCIGDFAVMTDKVFHAYSLGRERIADALEITRLAFGCSEAKLADRTRIFTIINTSSPLRLDGVMIEGAFEMARNNQLCVITPFTLSGAMSPVTIAGALAQQHAEALAGMALLQIYAPGCPVAYGGFTSNVDMKSGAPAFGTPENARAAVIGGQLARKVGVPYRSSNVNASNCVDAQATYESQMSTWAAVMGHANFLMHGAGWLEGGLCASFEKMIIDAEMLQGFSEFLRPLVVDDGSLGLDAVKDVGPGGHFFGTAHTLERYETAFYAPLVSDWNNFENWQDRGSKNATQRAYEISRQLLNDYQAPPIDEGRAEAIRDFIAKRKSEGGVAEG